jgi:hypothetical protein
LRAEFILRVVKKSPSALRCDSGQAGSPRTEEKAQKSITDRFALTLVEGLLKVFTQSDEEGDLDQAEPYVTALLLDSDFHALI